MGGTHWVWQIEVTLSGKHLLDYVSLLVDQKPHCYITASTHREAGHFTGSLQETGKSTSAVAPCSIWRTLSAVCCLKEIKKRYRTWPHTVYFISGIWLRWTAACANAASCTCLCCGWTGKAGSSAHCWGLSAHLCIRVWQVYTTEHQHWTWASECIRPSLLAGPSYASCPAWQIDGLYPQMAAWLSGVWAVSKAQGAKPAFCCLGASLEDAISRELPKLLSARGLSHH